MSKHRQGGGNKEAQVKPDKVLVLRDGKKRLMLRADHEASSPNSGDS